MQEMSTQSINPYVANNHKRKSRRLREWWLLLIYCHTCHYEKSIQDHQNTTGPACKVLYIYWRSYLPLGKNCHISVTARYRRDLRDAHRIYGFLYCHLIATFPQSICWARSTKFFPIKDAANLEVRRWKRWGRQRRRRIKGIYSPAFTWNDTRFREYLNCRKEWNESTYTPKIYRKLNFPFKRRKFRWRGGGRTGIKDFSFESSENYIFNKQK